MTASTGSPSSLATLVAATSATFTALVLVRAAWHKLRDLDAFAALLGDYRVLPPWAVGGVARSIVVGECAAVLALLVPRLAPMGAGFAALLLLTYSAAMSANMLRGRRELDCGCGGSAQGLGWPLIVRNLGLIAIAALALLPDAARPGVLERALSGAAALVLSTAFLLIEQLLANASRLGVPLAERAS